MSLSIWTRLKINLIDNQIDLNNLIDFEREIVDRNYIDWIDIRYMIDVAAKCIVDYYKHYFA